MAGAETSLLLTVRSLYSRFELAVACPVPSPLSKVLADEAIESYGLPHPLHQSYSSPCSCRYWIKAMRRLTAIVRTLRPDVIHANSVCAGVASLGAVLSTRTKLVIHARDLVRHRLVTQLCDRLCTKIVAVSLAVRDSLVLAGVKPSRIQVIYNAADDSISGTSEKVVRTAREGCPKRPFVFGNVGQFVPWKNQCLFLDAAVRVAEQLSNSRFVLVGDDVLGRDSGYRRQILSRVRSSLIVDKITLTGWRDDMARIWPMIDCLVHTADREPFGRVIIEAMSHQVPVIAVDACGPSEIIENGRTGILVPPNNVDALVLAMVQMAEDLQAAERIGMAGYNHVVSTFTRARMAQGLLDVYAEILAR